MNLLVGQASRLPLGRLAPAFVASETPAQAAGMAAPLPTAQFRRQPTASCVLGAVVRCTFRTSRRVPFPNGWFKFSRTERGQPCPRGSIISPKYRADKAVRAPWISRAFPPSGANSPRAIF